MVYRTVYTEVEVDVDMSDFETEDLIEELEIRGHVFGTTGNSAELLESIYQKRRLGKDYEADLDQLLWQGLGKVL